MLIKYDDGLLAQYFEILGNTIDEIDSDKNE